MAEKEYIVSLHKNVDYDRFWSEMESATNGLTFVPDRRIDIVNNRDGSTRSCHYALTDQEASILINDARVAAVAPPASNELKALNLIQTADFNRGSSAGQSFVNWGLRRCTLENLESNAGAQYPYCIDGAGVDIVIQDNGVQTGHPEWQDLEGNNRFFEHDWFEAAGIAGTMPGGHYGNVGDHGTHVAGIAAGKTYGWAKGARVYSIRYDLFDSEAFDLVKVWHQNKPRDPRTGLKRPTIVNQSWGYRWFYNNNNQGGVQVNRTYRGSTTTTASFNSAQGQITAYGGAHTLVYSPADVDQEELTDAGVICVRAAGNYYHKIELPGGDDYDNNYTYSGNFALGIITAGNPIYYHRGGSPWSSDTILVSNVDNTNYDSAQEQMAASSERGPGVYISAPGTQITSATSQGADYASKQVYPGNSNYYIARISGTSMAAPQVTGMLALFLQLNPAATSQQCKDWLSNFGSKEVMYATGLNDDYADSRSLMGQSRRFAYFPFAKDLGSRVNGAIVRK